jgi:hypothetical protein
MRNGRKTAKKSKSRKIASAENIFKECDSKREPLMIEKRQRQCRNSVNVTKRSNLMTIKTTQGLGEKFKEQIHLALIHFSEQALLLVLLTSW